MQLSTGDRWSYFRLVLAVALGFVASLAGSTDYYVQGGNPSCSDTGGGTFSQPWCSIQHAADVIQAGDTVYIRAGVYHEQVLTTTSGNPTNGYITFAAYPGEQPVIDGAGVTTGNNGIIAAHDYFKLVGLELRGWNDNAVWISGSAFFEINDCVVHDSVYGIGISEGSHDFVINRVEAYAFDLYGFDVSPNGVDCYNGTFNDCVARNARDPGQNVDGFALGHGTQHDFALNRCVAYDVYDGFDISADSTTLDRCAAYTCWNGGYKIWADNVTLVNCLGWASSTANLELDWNEEPGTTTLRNCTFLDAGTFNIWIENAGDSLHMYNCILAGGDNIGLAFEQYSVAGYAGDYNVFHNDDSARAIAVGYTDEFSLAQVAAGGWTGYSGQDAHSLVVTVAAELLVDPVGYDLHLAEGSAAIDSGTASGAPAVDYDGNPRPQGTGYDIGAYEHTSLIFADGFESGDTTGWSVAVQQPAVKRGDR